MMRLSHLEGTRVVTESGERLGRLWEIHSPGRALAERRRETRPIDSFLCGRKGLLERLGWKEPTAFTVPWSAVLAHEHGMLRVRGRADDYAGPRRARGSRRHGAQRRKR